MFNYMDKLKSKFSNKSNDDCFAISDECFKIAYEMLNESEQRNKNDMYGFVKNYKLLLSILCGGTITSWSNDNYQYCDGIPNDILNINTYTTQMVKCCLFYCEENNIEVVQDEYFYTERCYINYHLNNSLYIQFKLEKVNGQGTISSIQRLTTKEQVNNAIDINDVVNWITNILKKEGVSI